MRPLQIAHLCLAFTFFSYWIGAPFVSETLKMRHAQTLYDNLTGNPSLINESIELNSQQELSKRQQFWADLSEDEKAVINSHYEEMKANSPSTTQKIFNIFYNFLKYPIPLQAWFLLSMSLPIGVLLGNSKARWSLILLPILSGSVLFYPFHETKNDSIFPEEQRLYKYMHEPFSSSILEQKRQLERAFDDYLVEYFPECEAYGNDKLSFAKFMFLKRQFLQEGDEESWNPKPLAFWLTLWSLVYISGTFLSQIKYNHRLHKST